MPEITGVNPNQQQQQPYENKTKKPEQQEQEQSEKPTGGGLGEMDSDAFLQLLVTQMQHQDPMGETQDTNEFVTQVTMLSIMEQVIQFQELMESQEEHSQRNQTLNLLNREVELTDEHDELIKGTVASVDLNKNEITLKGEDGEYMESYPASKIERVEGGA